MELPVPGQVEVIQECQCRCVDDCVVRLWGAECPGTFSQWCAVPRGGWPMAIHPIIDGHADASRIDLASPAFFILAEH